MGESRKYRKFTALQKTEPVLASLRGPKTIARLCREHDISERLLRKWREQFLAAGAERLSGRQERTEADELRRQVGRLERALGRKTMELEVAGKRLRGWECACASPVPAANSSRKAGPPPSWPGCRHQPPGDLPAPEASARGSAAPLGRRGPRRRAHRAREPDRRHPHGRRARLTRGRRRGQPQAGAAADARASAVATRPLRRRSPTARLFPGHPVRRAPACGHDLDLGRRARPVLSHRRDRPLHSRDRRLGTRRPLPGR